MSSTTTTSTSAFQQQPYSNNNNNNNNSTTILDSTTTTTTPTLYSFALRKALSYYYKANQHIRYYLPYASEFGATQITPNLWLGDISDAMNVPHLNKNSISHIVTCVKSLKPFYPEEGFNYLNLHLYDQSDESIGHEIFQESFEYIDQAIQNGNNVLVHCMKGRSRSASILIAYLMRKNGWTYRETLKFVQQKRSIVQPNEGFERQLLELEKKLSSLQNSSNLQSIDDDTVEWSR
ncbi:hypothetical protein FDP41_004493 [Naegleria fowleri]|uniref:protein-tyrosine-phosphatase n=1 Tax=Naegleria fowleri TaxID=5763 RepID=A0A6A5BR05_NAEFO|nr:uncharacterized protein FDP41_004493 [Naegleria fowleri]KAF0976594.1 hypothetical protein FDP41_004493 [Naegleria fowleri]